MLSKVYDFGRKIPEDNWDKAMYDAFQKVAEEVKKADEKLGLKDCEDPSKAEWMKGIEKRLNDIEERLDKHWSPSSYE